MTKKLFFQAMGKFFAGLTGVAALIFLPAGTFRFPNGWLLMGLLFVPMFAAGLVLMARRPDLLRRRLQAKESQAEQRRVIALSGVMFLAAFVLSGLNFRFGWMTLSRRWVWTAAAVFLLSYLLYGEVLRENVYLSRTVGVEEGQTVVDTGLYGVVRHPMYAVTVLLFLSMPLILGSPLSFLVMLGYLPIIVRRIRSEERVLEAELPGYIDYEKKVKWRLLPGLW